MRGKQRCDEIVRLIDDTLREPDINTQQTAGGSDGIEIPAGVFRTGPGPRTALRASRPLRSLLEQPSRWGGHGVTSNSGVAGPTWADMLRAVALLRWAVGELDRLAGPADAGTAHPQRAMALIESSQSTQRTLVVLTEARQLLGDRFGRVPLQDALSDAATAESAYRVEEN
jgi:hypothetical protein